MAPEKDDAFYSRVGGDRIASRQIDELIGIARGLVADSTINHAEVEFLRDWLSSNLHISDQPVVGILYQRVTGMLADGVVNDDEKKELLDTLNAFSSRNSGTGEMLKSTSLPLDAPPPDLLFRGVRYCFTGTFNFGQRKDCEAAVTALGATAGSLTQKTNVLVVGVYATESWRHSSFGNKIMMACEWKERGIPISIVSELHWIKSLRAALDM